MATKIVTKNSSTAGAAPTATDLVQGELAVNVADGRLYTEDNAAAIVELGVNPATEITANAGIALPDSQKATFGASDDLQIYHDGSSSFIKDAGTGNLIIQATDLQIANADNTANYIRAFNGGAVDLRYAGSAKIATTSTGIDVTGTATADKVTIGTSSASNGKLTLEGVDGTDSAGIYFNNTTATNGKSYSLSSGNSGEFMLYDRTSDAYRLFVSSAGLVGIGTSSPTATTSIKGSTGFTGLDITDGSDRTILGYHTADGFRFTNVSAKPFVFKTNDVERMRIDSSGRVGIGTSSPYNNSKLDVAGSIISTSQTIGTYAADNAGFDFAAATKVGRFFSTSSNATGGHMTFITGAGGGNERMRIDSSGNVLVGTTTENVYDGTTSGVALTQSGYIFVGKSNDAPLYLNRIASDGVITNFAKDGTTVGSIGTQGSRLTIGNGDTGLRIAGDLNTIVPWNTTTNLLSDSAIDLGRSNQRFKDLYLSGGVYLGGTGAANKLDDYEEGTWTPFLDASSTDPSLTYNTQVGAYEKIGAFVHASFFINVSGVNSQGSGQLRIAGLPFTSSNNANANEVPAVMLQTQPFLVGAGAGYQQFARTTGSSSHLLMGYKTGDGNTSIPAGAVNVGTGYIIGHIVYRTLS